MADGETIRAERWGFGDFIAMDVPQEEDASMATRKENRAVLSSQFSLDQYWLSVESGKESLPPKHFKGTRSKHA